MENGAENSKIARFLKKNDFFLALYTYNVYLCSGNEKKRDA